MENSKRRISTRHIVVFAVIPLVATSIIIVSVINGKPMSDSKLFAGLLLYIILAATNSDRP